MDLRTTQQERHVVRRTGDVDLAFPERWNVLRAGLTVFQLNVGNACFGTNQTRCRQSAEVQHQLHGRPVDGAMAGAAVRLAAAIAAIRRS